MTSQLPEGPLVSGRVFILLPAYNEEEGLEKLLARIQRVMTHYQPDYRIIIVNDGSRDRTSSVIRSFTELPITLLEFPENRGIAAVFKEGFQHVLQKAQDSDVCITFDADNTHTPYVIPDMLKKIVEGNDIVIASRFVPGGGLIGVSQFRQLLSNIASWLLRRKIGLPGVKDYSTFYRAYRVRVLRRAFSLYGEKIIAGSGFSAMANLLTYMGYVTDKFAEVPLVIRYDLKEGGSGLPLVKTTRGYLRLIANYTATDAENRALVVEHPPRVQ